jgi:alpha-mannosidase
MAYPVAKSLFELKIALVSVAIVYCVLPCTANAQTPEPLAAKNLTSHSQLVLERLAALKSLPSPNWKVHIDDLPHGEDVSLDDSKWTGNAPNFEMPADRATWYRAWIEVPKTNHGYDLNDSRIWFQFRFSGSTLFPAIVYFNERRVAMGEALEPIVLFDNAKPGDRILVAVKLPAAGDTKHFRDTLITVEPPASRANFTELQQQFLVASTLIAARNDTSTDYLQLERAISSVNLEALEHGDQNAFDASIRQAQTMLESLRLSLQRFTFHLTGNSHIDAAWLWPWTETVDVVKRTFGTALQLLHEYPDYTYTQSAAQYTEWMADKYPYLNDEIRQRVKEGRWEIVGGMWVEPDLNMPDGESLVRQLLVGKRYFKDQYGVDVRIGWNPDSFGYSWQLPQIYKKSGIDYFVTTKLDSNETHKLPFKLFWWQAPDGSRILTYLPRSYGYTSLSPGALAREVELPLGVSGLDKFLYLYGVGDHGGGPTRVMLDEGVKWLNRNSGAIPKMRFGPAGSFFGEVERKIDGNSPLWNYQSIAKGYTPPTASTEGTVAIPTWRDELYYEFHRGTFTTQANHKRNMRESEEWLLNSEKYAALAWLAGDAYPASQFTESWKKVLFNQFHDLAAGSGIGSIYKDAEKDYEQVRLATNAISAKALNTIGGEINTRVVGEVPVLVFNPLAWKRSGLVTVDVQMPGEAAGNPVGEAAANLTVLDAQDHVVPTTVLSIDAQRNRYKLLLSVSDVPSLGYKVVHVVRVSKAFTSDLISGVNCGDAEVAKGTNVGVGAPKKLTLENASLRVTVDRETGFITSLYNKKSNFETLSAPGNQLQTFADKPKCCDAWNIDPGTLDHPNILSKADSVGLIENGPLRAAIRVVRSWQKSKFVQDITLYSGADQVEVTNDIDWHETHTLLKVAFPLAASNNFATYEIPYGTIDRPTTRNNSWEETMFEVPALRWADLGDGRHGFSLINESKYGYDAKDNVLRLSLLRSPTSPGPVADQGHHHFTYSLYPHEGDWKQALIERRGYEYNYKLAAMQVYPHDGSLPSEYSCVSVSPENVLLTAMKKAEDEDGLILRLVEWAGKNGQVKVKVPPGATSAGVTNLMEKAEGSAIRVIDDTVVVPIHPYEILSLRVDYRTP